MKTQLLVLLLCFCATQFFFAQEDDGVVSFRLPVRNSLTFNRYALNPTFSFVREQNKYISFYNKREWVQFDDSPGTYLAGYSGRFAENIGAGIGLFQQNYGVLSTFGGVLNFAYNARMARDSNLTFGLNIGAYKSGLDTGSVITNFDDPSLQNIPNNFLMTINPGINLGFEFIDLGISVNNLITYNFNTSKTIEDDPERGIQAHVMYTGYMNNRGFFDESKFSGIIRSEFKKDDVIISGIAMLTVPKGIWAQAGYNTYYGISAGIGLNITSQIALEYNIEKGAGAFTNFGNVYSHEITLAYRFKNNENYDYSSGDEVSGLLSTKTKRKTSNSKLTKAQADENRRLAAERRAKVQETRLAEQKAKEEAAAQAKLLAEQRAQREAEAAAQLLVEQKAQDEAAEQAKLLADQKAQEDAEAEAQRLKEQKAQEQAEAQEKLLADQKAREEAAAQAKLLAEQRAQQEAEAAALLLAEQKAKEEADAQAKLLADQKAQEEAEAQARLLDEQKVQEEADAEAQRLAEEKAKDELITNPQDQIGKDLYALSQRTEDSKSEQDELFKKIDDIVAIKDQDLKDLKEENDLSDQGIVAEPKPFKNTAAETNALEAMISELDNVIETRDQEIKELKEMYEDNYNIGTIQLNEVILHYTKTIDRLTSEQVAAKQARINIQSKLEAIKVATEFERNRRIKRAAFDNEEERFNNDRAMLMNIKKITPLRDQPYRTEDFDFGEEQGNNIQILKNVNNVDNGYYMIIAVHSDIEKRNEFLTKVVASGRTNVDFFYDVTTSKYFIYYNKVGSINEAIEALKTKGDRPYNTNMSIIKIEN